MREYISYKAIQQKPITLNSRYNNLDNMTGNLTDLLDYESLGLPTIVRMIGSISVKISFQVIYGGITALGLYTVYI